MITLSELNVMAKQFAKQYWNLDFNIEIRLNGRLSRSRARFCVRSGIFQMIEFQPSVLKYDSDENIIKTLKHEICHWALYNLKKPFRDGDEYFEKELIRIGSHSTGTTKWVGEVHYCGCTKCGVKVGPYRSAKIATKRQHTHVSGCCRARLQYLGPQLIDNRTTTTAADKTPKPTETTAPTEQMTTKQLADMFNMDEKKLRRKLRQAGLQKEGNTWSLTAEQVKKILGG